METLQFTPQSLQFSRTQLMNSLLFSRFKPKFFLTPYNSISNLKPFCTTTTTNSPVPFLDLKTRNCSSSSTSSTTSRNSTRVKVNGAEAARQLKEKWLHSLSCPFNQTESSTGSGVDSTATSNVGANWVIGIDPDLSGALALLKIDDSGCSTQVFDSPHLKVLVGNKIRKRLDAKSIVQLLHSFDAPIGTIAYIEQSQPFPKDGKQGWWSGGFGYGLWIGILVASGFSVVPVPSLAWKNEFELSGSKVSKDDSRRVASTLFPSLNSLLKRKKDHGRAEALLIAAYGKGLKLKSDLPCNVEEELP